MNWKLDNANSNITNKASITQCPPKDVWRARAGVNEANSIRTILDRYLTHAMNMDSNRTIAVAAKEKCVFSIKKM